MYVFCRYNYRMKRNPGRPKKAKKLSEYLEVRVEAAEKQTFKDAADLAGIPVSTWVRERLRRAAIRELEEAARPIAFLK
jgi:hypothetical protein